MGGTGGLTGSCTRPMLHAFEAGASTTRHPHVPIRPAPRPLVDSDAARYELGPLLGDDLGAGSDVPRGPGGAPVAVFRPSALLQPRPARRAVEHARRVDAPGRAERGAARGGRK